MQTWIFQGNPDYFDIDGYLAIRPAQISWLVRQHADEIQVDDTVFIWRNAGKQKAIAGVIAEATVIEPAKMRYEAPEAVPFWRGDAPEKNQERTRALLRLNRVASRKGVLHRERCENDPILHSLPNLRMAQATNYKLPPNQAAQLHLLWSSTSRNPVWSRDELILALDLYMQHRPSFPDDKHPEVIELSQTLNRLAAATTTTGSDSFRNGNGVAMKLQNFRRFDPSQQGKGLPGGGRGEEEVWSIFANDPERLRTTAAAIRAAVFDLEANPDQEPEEGEEAEEGKILTRLHRTRERDRGIVERRKAKALKDHGSLRCEACEFDFSAWYGERGNGFIECHHTKPVSALQPGEKTKLGDLALLCANCHRMVHVSQPWLTVDQLKQVLRR